MNFIAGVATGVSLTSDTIDLLLVDYSCKSASAEPLIWDVLEIGCIEWEQFSGD
jgi:hypothetical protein